MHSYYYSYRYVRHVKEINIKLKLPIKDQKIYILLTIILSTFTIYHQQQMEILGRP